MPSLIPGFSTLSTKLDVAFLFIHLPQKHCPVTPTFICVSKRLLVHYQYNFVCPANSMFEHKILKFYLLITGVTVTIYPLAALLSIQSVVFTINMLESMGSAKTCGPGPPGASNHVCILLLSYPPLGKQQENLQSNILGWKDYTIMGVQHCSHSGCTSFALVQV